MTRLALAPRALEDMERLTRFLLEANPSTALAMADVLLDGLALLKAHPLIGRQAEEGYRELIISHGRSGYLALYRYDALTDTALVLALRHQREAGYNHEP